MFPPDLVIVYSARRPRSHIVLALNASCHACLVRRKHDLRSPTVLTGESPIFWILSEPCGNADLVTFLHSHGKFANLILLMNKENICTFGRAMKTV